VDGVEQDHTYFSGKHDIALSLAADGFLFVKVVLKGYRIRRASASTHTLCPFPEYSPLFQNTIHLVSEDPDGYYSVSKGLDDYRMISGYRGK